MLLLSIAGFRKRGLSGRKNGLAKRFETTGIGKCTFFFGLEGGFTLGYAMAGLRVTLGGGSVGGLAEKKVSRVRMAVVLEVPISWKALAGVGCLISWMRSSTSKEALSAEEVAGMGKVDGINWTVFPKRVPLVVGT